MRTLMLAVIAASLITAAAAREEHVRFTLSGQNVIAVPALLNRTDPLTLMLHTAASDLALTEDAVKRLRSLTFDATAKAQSWGGSASARMANGATLEIGPRVRTGIAVTEDKNSGHGTDGKFGLDFFGANAVEIDFDASRIVVHDRLPAKAARYARLLLANSGGELYVEGKIPLAGKTYTTKFLLHSGYAGGVLLADEFAAASGIGSKIEITGETALKDAYDNTIKVKKGILPSFAIGPLDVEGVPVGFFEGKLGQQSISIVGMDVLKRFNLIVAKRRNALYLKRRSSSEAAGASGHVGRVVSR